MRYWLMKSEPSEFSFDDLKSRPGQTEGWDGVRNYQARNFMRDEMSVGDKVLFYHSNAKPPGVVGVAEVASEAYPDATAFDPESEHHDPKSDPENPRWYQVDVRFAADLERQVPLDELKRMPQLSAMRILQKGNRLSITPLTKAEFEAIRAAGNRAS